MCKMVRILTVMINFEGYKIKTEHFYTYNGEFASVGSFVIYM